MSATSAKMSKLIRQLFYILFFLTPLILWPFTSEVFEFNKMMFVYLLTIIIGAVWLIKSFLDHKFEIAKTPLDIPILLFLASQIISTVLSINPHTSLWGYYSRFHGGLMSTISYIVLYYALVTHFSNEKKAIINLITAILSSATIIAFYAILEHLGIDKNIWVQDVQNRVFSTLGQPNWLSAFLIALTPFALFRAINSRKNSRRFLYAGLSLLYLMAILFTKSQSGLGATAIVLLVFFIITAVQKHKSWLILSLLPIIALLFIFKGPTIDQTFKSLSKINPFYSNTLAIITEENKTRVGGSDSMTIRRVVWEGALKLGLEYPFFGTGVETFGYSYYWVRPAAHNLTSENDFLYNKAHNEYLNFLATTGFVGLATYLFLIGSIIFVLIKNKSTESTQYRLPLLLGFISILITNYFGFSVVNIALFFFLYPAIYIASQDKANIKALKLGFDATIGIIAVSAVALWTIWGLSKAWRADIAYNQGKESYDEAQKAIDLNPNEPIYYAQFGTINALVATQLIEPQIAKLPATASAQIKQEAQSYLDQYTSAAVENIDKAATMNPYNINILKEKAKTELILANLDPKYTQDAINTLLKITEYSPTESTNYFNIGLLYLNQGNKDQAKLAFQKAVDLKPDYQQAKDYLNQLSQPAAKK